MTTTTQQRADLADAKAMRERATAAKDKRILAMRAEGVPLREIAKAFNTSRSQIEKVLARNKP